MIIEETPTEIVFIDDKKNMKIVFVKHPYLPEYFVNVQLGKGEGGAAGLKFVRDAVEYMFTETPCVLIKATIDKNNKAAKVFCNTVPGELYRETETEWLMRSSIQYWMNSSAIHGKKISQTVKEKKTKWLSRK